MKVFRYKLYTNAKGGELDSIITRMGFVRNFAVRAFRNHYRYFKGTKRPLTAYQVINYIKFRKDHDPEFGEKLEGLPSQSVQNAVIRVYQGVKNYISYRKKKKDGNVAKESKPLFVKGKKKNRVRKDRVCHPKEIPQWLNKSFTLLQAGYRFNPELDKVKIINHWYGFHKSQPIKGRVKRITIKRDRCGDMWLMVLTDWNDVQRLPKTGSAVGMDFGLKIFLTMSDGSRIESPQFLFSNMKKYRRLCRKCSLKKLGSRRRKKARIALAKFLRHITNQREDWQWKVARSIVFKYDIICIEDLNLEAMKRLWGRKISDLCFGSFVQKLEYLSAKYGRCLVKVDRWYASSQICSCCGEKNPAVKDLKVREWVCPHCGAVHDRDINAAINILREGMSSLGRGSGKTTLSVKELVA